MNTFKEWLNDDDILQYIDELQFKTQYIKIISLDNKDVPKAAIEGRATGGSISINGNSSVRRSGSLIMITTAEEEIDENGNLTLVSTMHKVTQINSIFSLNKRISIEVGFENSGTKYPKYSMFWFPLGKFLIQNASVTYNNSGITINLKFIDKMGLLNGEFGGIINSAVTHSPPYIEDNNGDRIVDKNGIRFYDLIYSLVHDYGGIPADKIIIEDIDLKIKNIASWTGQSPIYIDFDNRKVSKENLNGYSEFNFEEPVAYTETDFIYPLKKELSSNAGDAITNVLDQIKNTLGNYEYFFDLDGNFRFQAIRNYLNEGSKLDSLNEAINEKYLLTLSQDKATYYFKDAKLITSYGNNPQYNIIKNDYHVWGQLNKDSKKAENAIHYHLRVETLPTAEELRQSTGLAQIDNENEQDFIIRAYRWSIYNSAKNKPKEARTLLEREVLNYYEDYWDKENGFFKEGTIDSSLIVYWLDFLDLNSISNIEGNKIKGFGIESIGLRSKVFNDEKINCLLPYQINGEGISKEYSFLTVENAKQKYKDLIEADNIIVNEVEYPFPTEDSDESIFIEWFNNIFIFGASYIKNGETKIIIKNNDFCVAVEIKQNLPASFFQNSAYDLLRMSLHECLSFNNNINLSTIPIYHLDVNQRIGVENKEADIQGEYIINNITVPLTLNGMMTINARQAVERF